MRICAQSWIKWLSLGLALQVGVFVYLRTRTEPTAANHGVTPLLSIAWEEVDRFTLEDSSKKPMEFIKKSDQWIMPGHYQAPVMPSKIATILEALKGFKRTWPAGKTMISAKQFDVVEDKFEKRLAFFKGETLLTTLYMGSSPSFRKVHARVDDQALTYSLDFNTTDLTLTPSDWLDKALNTWDRSKVTSLHISGLTFKRIGSLLTLDGVGEQEDLQEHQVTAFLEKVLNLPYEDITAAGHQITTPRVFAYQLTIDDQTIDVTFHEAEDKDSYLFSSAYRPFVFKVKKARIEELQHISRESLVHPDPAPATTSSTDPTPTVADTPKGG